MATLFVLSSPSATAFRFDNTIALHLYSAMDGLCSTPPEWGAPIMVLLHTQKGVYFQTQMRLRTLRSPLLVVFFFDKSPNTCKSMSYKSVRGLFLDPNHTAKPCLSHFATLTSHLTQSPPGSSPTKQAYISMSFCLR